MILAFTALLFSCGQAEPVQCASKPLFEDPVFDGPTDPILVWNEKENNWLMFYTQRRANVDSLGNIEWVHGTRIGVAESSDGGATWAYRDTCNIGYRPDEGYTHWAPDIIENEGTYHMYLTYVPGVFPDWRHPRDIVHLTSENLMDWKFESKLDLSSDRSIDACILRKPDGGWRMYYNNERDGKSMYYAESDDLYHWIDSGKKVVGDKGGEGAKVFQWKGKYRMIVDNWDGLGVYSSDDLENWTRQKDVILKEPGTGAGDNGMGHHADVVINDGRAYIVYFVHPQDAASRTSRVQVAELELADDGQIVCHRDNPVPFKLIPPVQQ